MLKRILLAWLLVSVPLIAQTGVVQGHCYLGGTKAAVSGLNSTNYMDGIIPSCTVTVYLTGTTTLASITNSQGNANPMAGNTASSVDPGGWLFRAAVNQGLDVVMTGGIPPNTYTAPVTLTAVYPSQSFTPVAGVTSVQGTDPVQVNGDSGTPHTGGVTVSCPGCLANAITSINGQTGPAVTVQSSRGTVSVTTPTTNTVDLEVASGSNFSQYVTAPTTGQYVIVKPTGFTYVTGPCADTHDPDAGSVTATANGSMVATAGPCGTNTGPDIEGATWTFTGALEAAGINPANVTNEYGVMVMGVTQQGVGVSASASCHGNGFVLPNSGISTPISMQQFNTTALSVPGGSVDTITCTSQALHQFATNSGTITVNLPLIALAVYYTGTPVTQPSETAFNAPLNYNAALGAVNLVLPYDIAADTGTVNAYVAYNPSFIIPGQNSVTQIGTQVKLITSNANTSTTPTFNLNGIGALLIETRGANPIAVGDIAANVAAILTFQGTYWELDNPQTVLSETTVGVNSTNVSAPNFSDTTPAASSNGKNVSWQHSGSSVSAEIVGDGNATHYLDGTGNYSTPSGGSSGAYDYVYLPNCATTGTTNGLWAMFNGTANNQCVRQLTAGDITGLSGNYPGAGSLPIVGIVVSGGGTTGLAKVAISGQVPCQFDGGTAPSQGDMVQVSTSNYGCQDLAQGPMTEHTYWALAYASTITSGSSGTIQTVQITTLPINYATYQNAAGTSYPNNLVFGCLNATGGSQVVPCPLYANGSLGYTDNAIYSQVPFRWLDTGSGYFTAFGGSTSGASANDFILDTQTHAGSLGTGRMFRLNTSYYAVPSISTTVSGTVDAGIAGQFVMGSTTGLFQWTLTGDATLATINHDNTGHFINFIINPNGHTWTWPAAFQNVPSTWTGSSALHANFYYNGTNYWCWSGDGCSGSGGSLSGMTAGQVPIAASATTVTSSKALAGSGTGIVTGPTTSTSGDVVTYTGTAGQTQDSGTLLNSLAPLASPTFTGTPAAPTATSGTNTTQLATTAFVQAAIAAAGTGAGIVTYSGPSVALTGTQYFAIGGGATSSTTESNVDIDAPAAVTIQNMTVQLSSPLGLGNTTVFTWRKNGADTVLTCTITGSSQTSCSDTTHNFTTAALDLLSIKAVTTGTVAGTPTVVMAAQVGVSAAGTTAFSSLSGGTNTTAAMQVSSGASLTVDGGTFFKGTINTQTGTSYAFVSADNGKLTTFNNSSAQAVTLSQATTTGFTTGATFNVQNIGSGTVTITPSTSTINGASTLVLTSGMGASIVSNGTNYAAQVWTSTSSGGGYPTPVTLTASASSSLDFTTCISGSYRDYELRFSELTPTTTTADIVVEVSSNGGSTWDTTAANYSYGRVYNGVSQSLGLGGTSAGTNAGFSLFYGTGGAHGGVDGRVTLFNLPNTQAHHRGIGSVTPYDTSAGSNMDWAGWDYTPSAAINALRVIATSSTLASGTVTCQPLPQ